jgi:hypothetical protein
MQLNKHKRNKGNKHDELQTLKILSVICFFLVITILIGPSLEIDIKSSIFDYNSYYSTSTSELKPNSLDSSSPSPNSSPNTAVIVTSSWIPTHPSTEMIDTVIKSVRQKIIGLDHQTTPIFITVDALPSPSPNVATTTDAKNKIEMIDKYITNLYARYLLDPQIHILINQEHHHIGGSVWKALQQIKKHYKGSVEYLYYVQHDFEFVQDIDHRALMNAMNTNISNSNSNSSNTDTDTDTDVGVNYVLFEYKRMQGYCHGGNKINVIPSSSSSSPTTPLLSSKLSTNNNSSNSNNTNTSSSLSAHLCRTCKYSDNNHLVKFEWYYNIIGKLGMFKRAPEDPMQFQAARGCKELGLYLYNSNMNGYALRHLDGRQAYG